MMEAARKDLKRKRSIGSNDDVRPSKLSQKPRETRPSATIQEEGDDDNFLAHVQRTVDGKVAWLMLRFGPDLLELTRDAVEGDRKLYHARVQRYSSQRHLYGLVEALKAASSRLGQRLEHARKILVRCESEMYSSFIHALEQRLHALHESMQRVADQDEEEQDLFEQQTTEQMIRNSKVNEVFEEIFEEAAVIDRDPETDSSDVHVLPFDPAILEDNISAPASMGRPSQAAPSHPGGESVELEPIFPGLEPAFGYRAGSANGSLAPFRVQRPRNANDGDALKIIEWIKNVYSDDAETDSEPDLDEWSAPGVGISDTHSMVAAKERHELIESWRRECEQKDGENKQTKKGRRRRTTRKGRGSAPRK